MNLLPSQSVGALRYDGGNVRQKTRITCIADTGVIESSTLTASAGSGAAQGDFFLVTNVAGTVFAIWLDIDAAGTEPNGAIYTAADTKIEVNVASSDTAAQLMTKIFTAVDGNITNVTVVDGEDGTMTITQDVSGVVANVAVYDETEEGESSLSVVVNTEGVDSVLNSKYFQIDDGDSNAFYIWFDVASEGSDPSGTGTGIQVDISLSDTAASVATALAAALTANVNFEASVYNLTSVDVVTKDAIGKVDLSADSDTGFLFQTIFLGNAEVIGPGKSPTSYLITPNAIS